MAPTASPVAKESMGTSSVGSRPTPWRSRLSCVAEPEQRVTARPSGRGCFAHFSTRSKGVVKSYAGQETRSTRAEAGVTLIEMLVVAALVGIMAAISFPAATAGLDGLRLNSASDSIVSFLNAGLNRAERRQQVVEISVSPAERALSMRSTEPGFARRLVLPDGVSIVAIHPDIVAEASVARRFLLYPGGTVPRIGIEIANRRLDRRVVRVDPITGVPLIEKANEP